MIIILYSLVKSPQLLPNIAFFNRIHRGTSRTAPVKRKFWHVSKWSVNTENCRGVGVGQNLGWLYLDFADLGLFLVHLVLQRRRSSNGTPNAGSRQPEKLALAVAQSRKDWLGSVSPDNTLVSSKTKKKVKRVVSSPQYTLPKCFLNPTNISNIFSLSCNTIYMQLFSFNLRKI